MSKQKRRGMLPIVAAAACFAVAVAARGDVPAVPPAWAFPGNVPSAPQPPADPDERVQVPGSKVAFARRDLRNLFSPPDWYPEDHPMMPEIVGQGRRPRVGACAYCHLPSGEGRPENAALAGLPETYILHQMEAFKSGERTSSLPDHAPAKMMAAIGKAASEADVRAAAAYFAHLPMRSHVTVIESRTAPRTVARNWLLATVPGGSTEPLGDRIVETPVDLERFEMRDAHVPILAYVPIGSISAGRMVASGKAGKGIAACTACHGPGLHGTGSVPSLAGKSPSYVVRQLYDFRSGARSGQSAAPMKTVVAGMSDADMRNVGAYLASLPPGTTAR